MQIPIILAEVSDKIPCKGAFVFVGAVFLCAVSIFAVQRCLWAVVLELTIMGVGVLVVAQEFFFDIQMRDAVIAEQGMSYYVTAFVSLTLPIVSGITLYAVSRNHTGQQPASGDSLEAAPEPQR